jgi:hypothetical protein
MSARPFSNRLTVRYRQHIALAAAGWMLLSLVLTFWPCCHLVADEHAPVVSMESDDHDHGGISHGTEDPCRTWLDVTDVAFNPSPGALVSDFELKIGHLVYAEAYEYPVPELPEIGRYKYHPSPPASLPLYLRLQHLLI